MKPTKKKKKHDSDMIWVNLKKEYTSDAWIKRPPWHGGRKQQSKE